VKLIMIALESALHVQNNMTSDVNIFLQILRCDV